MSAAGRAMMLRVNEEGVEYLPTLATHSLEAVEVPEAVVKEWRRRKGAAAAEAEHAHQLEQAGVVLETASIDRPSSGAGRGSPVAQTLSRLGHYLRRIKKMVPLDERGMWLLKNLLTQTRVEDQEELCRSIQDKLSNRKGALTRSKDRLKLECDRRSVFTKAANEIRTSSEMTCESNRTNVLSTLVKDHLHVRRQMEQKRRQKEQRLGRTNSAAAAAAAVEFPAPPSSSLGGRGPHGRAMAVSVERSRGEAGGGPKETGSPKTQIQEPEPLPLLPPPPLVLSTKTAKMPLSGVIVGTSAPQPDRVNSGDGGFAAAPAPAAAPPAAAAAPANVSRKRRRAAHNAPPVQRGGVLNVSPLGGHVPVTQQCFGVQADVSASCAGAWKERRLDLPPLEERYPNVKDSWVYSPVELRLQRPRCKSVDVSHLDQPAYREYLKRVLRAGAAAVTWQEDPVGAETHGQEQRVAERRPGKSLIESQQRDRTAGRYFRESSSCLPVRGEEPQAGGGGGGGEEGDDSGHRVSFLSSVSRTSPTDVVQTKRTSVPRSGGNGLTDTAAPVARSPANGGDHRLVERNIGCGSHRAHGAWSSAQTTPVLARTLSRFQLREGENGVFRLTSCDVEDAPRPTANGGGGGGGQVSPTKARRGNLALSQHTAFGLLGHDDRSSAASTTAAAAAAADDALASEALRLRSKGARMVFKQTQRLLGALRTPASSSQTTSTGARRGCGGGSVGGDSSVVVHHRGGAGDAGHGGVGGIHSSSPDPGSFPGRDDEVWRATRGTRPARLAEVFRCVIPPHTVRIECEILLHESLSRTGGGRDGGGSAGSGHNGTWDDFVFAWECLGDGILAGRALSYLWEHENQDVGGTNDASRSERAADDLLSDGLRQALLATHTYRPPGVDQLFVEWLDELLEVIRVHVRRACARVPLQHGLTAGLGWFKEVCNDQRFLAPARVCRGF